MSRSGSKLFDTVKVSKGAKIRNRYNQVPHLTQDTNGLFVVKSDIGNLQKNHPVGKESFFKLAFVVTQCV